MNVATGKKCLLMSKYEMKRYQAVCNTDLLWMVILTSRQITVTAALLHVMSPHQAEIFITAASHTLISLKSNGQTKCVWKFTPRKNIWWCFSHLLNAGMNLKPLPCTLPSGDFHFLANKGRWVSPGVKQAPREQQWSPEISADHSGRNK